MYNVHTYIGKNEVCMNVKPLKTIAVDTVQCLII